MLLGPVPIKITANSEIVQIRRLYINKIQPADIYTKLTQLMELSGC